MHNRALNKTASQMTTHDQLVASRAVDGRKETKACTKQHDHPWWSVDLGEPYAVGRVVVTFSRPNYSLLSLTDYTIVVLEL